jgi:ribosomal-protein-alanine N-acetyltransferase
VTWTVGSPVRLETERAVLRSLTVDDVGPVYVGWLRDPEVTRYMNARFDEVSEDTVRAFVSAHDDRERFLLGIFDRASGKHVGNHRAICHAVHRRAHVGVMIGDRDHWGTGIVPETRTVLLDFLFGAVGMLKVCGEVYALNAAAIFNYQVLGFTVEGALVSHAACGQGRSDVVLFAMLRHDWLARRGVSV